jgi:hypothetical protein
MSLEEFPKPQRPIPIGGLGVHRGQMTIGELGSFRDASRLESYEEEIKRSASQTDIDLSGLVKQVRWQRNGGQETNEPDA